MSNLVKISAQKIGIDPSVIPYMTPAQIDNFIDWIRERVDFQAFLRSDQKYKLRQIKLFFQLNPGEAQLSLF